MQIIDNLNKIEYLANQLLRLRELGLDVLSYQKKFESVVKTYEQQIKENQNEDDEKITLKLYENFEVYLAVELDKIETKLHNHFLLLKLIDLTKNWDTSVSLESFDEIEKNITKIVMLFPSVKKQKEILQKYHDLLWKKMMYDYQQEDDELIKKHTTEEPYLVRSIEKYFQENQKYLDSSISSYDLPTILSKLNLNKPKEVVEELDSIKSKEVVASPKISKKESRLLYLGEAKDEVIKRIGLKKASHKDFRDVDLSGIDLSTVDFTGVQLYNTALVRTKANIDPQTINWGPYLGINNRKVQGCIFWYISFYRKSWDNLTFKGFNNIEGTLSFINVKKTKILNPYNLLAGDCLFNCEKREIGHDDFDGKYIYPRRRPEFDLEINSWEDIDHRLEYLGREQKSVLYGVGFVKAMNKKLSVEDLYHYANEYYESHVLPQDRVRVIEIKK